MASNEDDAVVVFAVSVVLVLMVLGVLAEHRGEACHSK